MNISIIAAIGEDNSLGKEGELCWKISEDLKYFKELTLGGVVIMGRKTWESLPIKPLPGRRNIIVTRNKDYNSGDGEILGDLKESIKHLEGEGVDTIYVIGGGEIYRQSINFATGMHLTRIYDDCPEADTFFPKIDLSEWSLFTFSDIITNLDGTKYRYETWIRK